MDGTFRCLYGLSSQKCFISSLALQCIQAYFLPHHTEEQISIWEVFLFRFHRWVISFDICLWLSSLSMIISRSIHVAANGIISLFFLWLSSIPLCVCLCVWYIYMYKWYISVCLGLGCFHVLAIVDSAAMSIEVCASFQIIVLSRYMFRSRVGW